MVPYFRFWYGLHKNSIKACRLFSSLKITSNYLNYSALTQYHCHLKTNKTENVGKEKLKEEKEAGGKEQIWF